MVLVQLPWRNSAKSTKSCRTKQLFSPHALHDLNRSRLVRFSKSFNKRNQQKPPGLEISAHPPWHFWSKGADGLSSLDRFENHVCTGGFKKSPQSPIAAATWKHMKTQSRLRLFSGASSDNAMIFTVRHAKYKYLLQTLLPRHNSVRRSRGLRPSRRLARCNATRACDRCSSDWKGKAVSLSIRHFVYSGHQESVWITMISHPEISSFESWIFLFKITFSSRFSSLHWRIFFHFASTLDSELEGERSNHPFASWQHCSAWIDAHWFPWGPKFYLITITSSVVSNFKA